MEIKKWKQPEKKYYPLNYWGWLGNSTPEETIWQVNQMNQVGYGGYVMHARGGLEIPYMGKQWMDSVQAMVATGAEHEMLSILDDEDGWPSGFGAGLVNGMGKQYWQKWLQFSFLSAKELTPDSFTEETILGYYFLQDGQIIRIKTPQNVPSDAEIIKISYHQNPYYVDNLDPTVVQKFIEVSYDAYYDQLKEQYWNNVYAIFSDEPQIARSELTWSLILPERFQQAYGYDLIDNLPALFCETENCETIRADYWQLVNDLFVHSYAKQIYDWCDSHGIQFTGHTVLEENLGAQLTGSAGTMKYYEYEHIPGVDWLCRIPVDNVLLKQVVSVAEQLGKERVLSEMYGCSGWNASFMDLKWIAEWQFVMGINLMLQHLGLYSLKGSRKREYPPSLFYQQPWWKDMNAFHLYFARLSKLITESTTTANLLVIHPLKTAWRKFNIRNGAACQKLDTEFHQITNQLVAENHEFHYGDEDLMKKYASVVGNQIRIGLCTYDTVLIPCGIALDTETQTLLDQFQKNGGKLVTHIEELTNAPKVVYVSENAPKTVYTAIRTMEDGRKFCYAVNTSRTEKAKFYLHLPWEIEWFHLEDATLSSLSLADAIQLEPTQSLFLIEQKENSLLEKSTNFMPKQTTLIGTFPHCWTLENCSENSITLDYCTYKKEKLPVISLQQRMLQQKKPMDVAMEFTVVIASLPDSPVYLGLEEPQKCTLFVNGCAVEMIDCGWWTDKSIRKIDITPYLQKGENTLLLTCHFWCSDATYRIKNDPTVHEAEANRVTVETELESIYLLGDFDVAFHGTCRPAPNDALFLNGTYCIEEKKKTVDLTNLPLDGYPFFRGTLTVSHAFYCIKKEGKRYRIQLEHPCATLFKVKLNDTAPVSFLWTPYEMEITDQLQEGKNTIVLELTNTCRNLFGPHHSLHGEILGVAPPSYFQNNVWTDEYCMVNFGIEGAITIEEYDL